MTTTAKDLRALLDRATQGAWELGTETRGSEICTIHGVPRQPTEDGLGQGWVYIHYQRFQDGKWHWPDEAESLTNAVLIATAINYLRDNIDRIEAMEARDAE